MSGGELNVVDDAWNSRVTSHVALKDVSSLITVDSVYETITFVNSVLKVYGKKVPRIAVSGINPHCGENGLFGSEEGDVIEPAIKKAREDGSMHRGPSPAIPSGSKSWLASMTQLSPCTTIRARLH